MNMLPTPDAPAVQVTAATCQAAGTATISNYDALYTYTFSPEGPAAGANGLISGMAYGTSYTVTAKNISNCTSAASASFSIMNMLPTPVTPTVQVTAATCQAAGTATISNYDALYTYTFSPEGPTAGANGLISGMAYGTSYTVTAKNISNCTSAASASFSIMNMLPTPDAPAIQVTAATCQAAGTATISNYDALYTYTFSPAGPSAGANGVISGFSTDVSYTVTATNISNCTSEASESFMVPAALDAPDAPTIQVTAATCEAAGTATISNYNANYTYTFSPEGPAAGANGLISGMAYGTSYTVTATNDDDCISAASASFSIMNMLPTPDAPEVQVTAATCQAAGTATISNYNANYTYTFSPTGPSAGANGLISGMAYGTSYTVTAKNISNCTSAASASFSVMNMLPTPMQPTVEVTAATCEAAGTATISNYNANYTYTFSPTGPSAGANGLISGMAYGTSYTVTAKNISNCTSAASASFSIMNMLPTPDAPTIQVTAATCEAAGTATISNYDALYTYTFSPTGPSAGANGVISSFSTDVFYTVTATNISNCTSGASEPFMVLAALDAPDAPTIQVTAATCEAAGTATISNYDALYTYTFSPEGPTAGANGLISGMAYGTSYTVTATNDDDCISAASASFSIMNMLPTPDAPAVQVTAATCQAAGTATISNYNANYTYTFSPEGPAAGANGVISGFSTDVSYTVTATNISNCTSEASEPFMVLAALDAPDAPEVQVTAATCEAAGTATISNYDALYTYTFSPEGPTAGANGLISGMAYGTSYTVTAKNISNCTSAASASFSIMNMLPTPDAPAVQVTAATCQAAGTATISNYDALYTYTFSPAGPSAGANGIISNLAYGTSYTVTATNIDDCISAASASFSVMNMLPTPMQPTVEVTAATCQAAGTATISNYDANYTYTFSPTGPSAGANGVISNLAYGTSYTVTATNIDDCISAASASFSIEEALDAPTLKLISATCSEDFHTYNIVFESNGIVSSTSGMVDNDAKTVTGILAGTDVTLTATLNGCTTTLDVTAPYCGGCPDIQIISVTVSPSELVMINSKIVLNVTFTAGSPVNLTVNWDDGNTQTFTGIIDGLLVTEHIYQSQGVYTLHIEAENDCGKSTSEIYEYVVVYDPSAGFVTGGGWIISPAGAYRPDPTLTGKANFGFVSKYVKGKTVPTGHTEFQFHAAGFNFSSTEYEWLLVSGNTKAQFKGTGTVNGMGNYGFLVTVTDGLKTGPDQFRIKIWDKENHDEVVYDNNSETIISGGSIVIHYIKTKSAEIVTGIETEFKLAEYKVYPNPFAERLRFEFVSPESCNARIDLFDMNGRLVKTIFEQQVEADQYYEAEFKPETIISAFYVYRITLGDLVQNGKVIFKKE
jgi:membrane associated rhomboid family serine protease